MRTTELYKEWQSLQPLSRENKQRLDEKFMLDFNYNSNHIEGNTLTYGQTKLLLIFDKTTGTANMRDFVEMKAHNVGLEMMKREALDKERPLTEAFIRELNKIIQVENYQKVRDDGQGTYEVHVGVYKTRPNSVMTAAGVEFHYASPEETPALMTQLIEWYNQEEKRGVLTPVELAALLHYRYIRIHPFEDGNGRIARLLVNYVLLRHGYPMIVIPSADKSSYLDALNLCDVEVGSVPADGALAELEQIQPFTAYIHQYVDKALDLGIKAAKGESIEEDGDLDKEVELLKKEMEADDDTLKTTTRLNKEVLLESLNGWIKKLFTELAKTTAQFNDFYDTPKHNIMFTLGGSGTMVEFKENPNLDILDKVLDSYKSMFNQASLVLNTSYGVYKKGGIFPFGCNYSFYINFEEFSYEIRFDTFSKEKKDKQLMIYGGMRPLLQFQAEEQITVINKKWKETLLNHLKFHKSQIMI